jgi:serine/threonine-protein kinase
VSSPGATEEGTRPPADSLCGTVIGERYKILERVGEGAMGAVYRAEHTLMKKIIAVKLLHPELGRLDEVAKRFEREAQSASRLNHQHIIQVTDFGRMPNTGALFLVMEFVRGESLASALKRGGRLPPARAVAITRQMLSALEHAHAEGVVHRDLKPENVMLVARQTIPPMTPGAAAPRPVAESEQSRSAQGQARPSSSAPHPPRVDFIKILDFGIAKMSDDAPAGGSQPLTQAGVVFGTPDYMSPEQAMGDRIDGRSDLYSTGVILFEMLSGQKPFSGKSHVEIISQHLTKVPPTLRTVAPDAPISGALEQVVRRALAKKREERFRSATEFLSALDGVGEATHSGLHAHAPSRSLLAQVRPLLDRVPPQFRRLLPAFAIALLAILFGTFALRHHGPASTPPPPKPATPEVARYTQLAEEALSQGDLAKARIILTEQLAKHPEAARVHYLMGNVDFLERKPEAGMDAYREAMKRDPGYRGDAALLRNVRLLLDDKRLAPEALDLMIKDIGKPAGAAIAEVATSEKRMEMRHAALRACTDLGCDDKVDKVGSYTLDLQQEKTCEERRDAVAHLRKLGDRRALDALRRARRRGGGLFGLLSGSNECIRKELDDAIKALE